MGRARTGLSSPSSQRDGVAWPAEQLTLSVSHVPGGRQASSDCVLAVAPAASRQRKPCKTLAGAEAHQPPAAGRPGGSNNGCSCPLVRALRTSPGAGAPAAPGRPLAAAGPDRVGLGHVRTEAERRPRAQASAGRGTGWLGGAPLCGSKSACHPSAACRMTGSDEIPREP